MRLLQYLFSVLFVVCSHSLFAYDLVVAQDGSGNYTSIQEAINAAPSGRTTAYTIYIKNGLYQEKVTIPSSKPFLKLIGESVGNTVVIWNDYAALLTGCSTTLGTQNSAGFSINATDFTAVNITFVNAYGDGSQAVTVLVNADRAAFRNCQFLGNQDTLYLKGGGTPRAYFQYCYIDGNVDFIFGSSVAYFDSCVIYAKNRSAAGVSYITAPNTPSGQSYGFIFNNPILPNHQGATQYYLSRPWPSPSEVGTAQQVILLNARMSGQIHPAGWSVWNANTITANLDYAEYQSRYFDGTLVDTNSRVSWSKQLTTDEAAIYNRSNVLGSWNPLSDADFTVSFLPSLAAANFRAVKGTSSTALYWNMSWLTGGATCEVQRSSDGTTYNTLTSYSTSDTLVNMTYTDPAIPPSGTNYYYRLQISKSGYITYVSNPLTVSSRAQVIVNASSTLYYCGILQSLGTPSAIYNFTVTGTNLVSPVELSVPAPFELSPDGVNWYTSGSAFTLTPDGSGNLAVSTIQLRLNASAIGSYSGSISILAAQTTAQNIQVTGRTVGATLSEVLQAWPLTSGTADDPAVRNPGVEATSPAMMNLFTTDGSLPAPAGTIPAYSVQYGQAFGANAAGNNWQNVGGTLKRHYYQEFTVRSLSNSSVRVDSITFQANFYATASSTKMAVVYSKNGFQSPADSTEFSDGINGTGNALTLAASGNFARSFALTQNNSGATETYSLALNGNTGVEIQWGQVLTIRLYFACSSTGTPRFALLKNVKIKGQAGTALPIEVAQFEVAPQTGHLARLNWILQQTGTEMRCVVERSSDGRNFQPVREFVNRSSARWTYQYTDTVPQQLQRVWYRLKLQEPGSTKYSVTRFVNFKSAISGIQILQAEGGWVVRHAAATSGAAIRVFDAGGRCYLQQKMVPGSTQTWLPAPATRQLYYLLILQSDGAEGQWIF